jgi:hypothetical protein
MKKVTIVFLTFAFIAFLTGIYFCLSYDASSCGCKSSIEGMDGMDGKSKSESKETLDDSCPDMLIRSGDSLLLYNSKKPDVPGENPIPFYTIDEYVTYLEREKNKNGGKAPCPILYVQEETNTQGDNVYRVRPGPFDQDGKSLPATRPLYQEPPKQMPRPYYDRDHPMPVMDASRDSKKFNKGEYNGFDPYGQQIGLYTNLDKIHDSTELGAKISDNPMDSNWGGILYTRDSVASGKYKENEIMPEDSVAKFLLPNDSLHGANVEMKSVFA